MGQAKGVAHQRRKLNTDGLPPQEITRLRRGMCIQLPSGNRVLLESRIGNEWICAYARDANSSGQVVFTSRFLTRWGKHADDQLHP